MNKDQFISLCFIALLTFVVWEVFQIFSPFFRAIFWSAILAFGFFPLYVWLRKKLRRNETLAAALTTIAIFLTVIPPVVFLAINLTAQAIDLYQAALDYVREGHLEQLIERIRSFGIVERLEARIFEWGPLKEKAAEWLLASSKAIGNFAATQAGNITKNLFFLSLNVFLMTFLTFVFLKDGERIYNFIYKITPLEEKNKKPIFKQINDTFTAVIRGQILTSMTQAIVAGFIFWILGLPAPILFAALTFLAALVPVAGAAVVWLPLSFYLLLDQQTVRAIILAVLGVSVISVIDNLMKPAIIGEKTKLPYFLLFFGILGGLKLYGFMGIFLAPVILSLFFSLIKIYQEKYS